MYKPEEGLVIAGQDKQRLRCRGLGPECSVSTEQYTAMRTREIILGPSSAILREC
jgi:hypothetical protein